jgi:hypothetical protein
VEVSIAGVIGVIAFVLWDRRRERRLPRDLSFEQREGEYGWRLLRTIAGALAIMTTALILDALDVPFVGWIAIGALVVLLIAIYIGPWTGPKRRQYDN